MKGKMERKGARGTPRKGMLDEVMVESYGNMKRKAENSDEWRDWMPFTYR